MADLLVTIKDAEIRGVEEKEGRVDKDGKKGAPFLVVRIDDVAGNRHELLDRDAENISAYKRGTVCDIVANIKYGFGKTGGWCRFEVKELQKK